MNYQIPRKVGTILILVAFVYQLYDVTRDYLRYNYLIEVDVKEGFGIIPSVTVCVNRLHRTNSFNQSAQNWTKSYLSFHKKTIICLYLIR